MSRMFSIRDLIDITGKGDKTIKKRLEAIVPTPGSKGAKLYDSREALNAIFAQVGDLSTERAKLTVLQQQLTEIKIGELRKELFPVRDISKILDKEYAYLRAQLRSLPSRLAKPLSMISDPNKVDQCLAEAIDECLTELNADAKFQLGLYTSSSTDVSPNGSSADATSDSGGVGGQPQIPESGVEFHTGPLED